MTGEICTVSEVVESAKNLLENNFRNIIIEGEISNFSTSMSGHYYFSLSDDDASISCAVFKGDAYRNPLLKGLKDGDKIMLQGSISVYKKRGNFQLIGKKVFAAGKGDLLAKLELLKQKLQARGMFDLQHKKPIPKFPKKISLITALQGAALQDMLNVFKRRGLSFNIVIIPAVVQGAQAPASVIAAIEKAIKISSEVIVLARGGGSLEDLWGFNNESLAEKVFDCPVPIISAVGHQVDFSLCDFVADLRCETPTAAAEILTQEQTQINLRLKNFYHRMEKIISETRVSVQERLQKLNPINSIEYLRKMINKKNQLLMGLSHRFQFDLLGLNEKSLLLDDFMSTMQGSLRERYNVVDKKIDAQGKALSYLNPNNVLKRGYTYLNYNKMALEDTKAFDKIKDKTSIEIIFHDGKRKVTK